MMLLLAKMMTGCGLAILLGLLVFFGRIQPKFANWHHRKMRRSADRALKLFSRIQTPGKIFAYVRKMHPHAVEELVLSAALRCGYGVRRNQRYTGDGGCDGQIRIENQWYLVQTKRYSSAINPAHVTDFRTLCLKSGQPGLFIHFGRTGPLAKSNAQKPVTIVSGPLLVALLLNLPPWKIEEPVKK